MINFSRLNEDVKNVEWEYWEPIRMLFTLQRCTGNVMEYCRFNNFFVFSMKSALLFPPIVARDTQIGSRAPLWSMLGCTLPGTRQLSGHFSISKFPTFLSGAQITSNMSASRIKHHDHVRIPHQNIVGKRARDLSRWKALDIFERKLAGKRHQFFLKFWDKCTGIKRSLRASWGLKKCKSRDYMLRKEEKRR